MKGLILSLALFAAHVAATAILCHFLRPARHSKLFGPAIAFFTALYWVLYGLTPPGLGFLPPAWQGAPAWLDALAGCVVLLLNHFSYLDWFFGFNGGFSMSLLLELHRAGDRGLDDTRLVERYALGGGGDKIIGWRLPRLLETGYLASDGNGDAVRLTPKGRLVARLTMLAKRVLSLGAGG